MNWFRRQRLKQSMKPVSALPLLQKMKDMQGESREVKEAFLDELHNAFEDAADRAIERALLEKKITLIDLGDWGTLGASRADIGLMLSGHYTKEEREKQGEDDNVCILAMPESTMMVLKGVAEKRFGVNIIVPEQMLKIMKEEEAKKHE